MRKRLKSLCLEKLFDLIGKDMSDTSKVEIECPTCGHDNTVPRPWELRCQKCNASLKSGKYSKRIMSTGAALVLGIGGTLGADQMLSTDRYPINLEYAIIDSCINESKRPLQYSRIINKRDICICALEKTQGDFNANADNITKDDFILTFEKNADECINE